MFPTDEAPAVGGTGAGRHGARRTIILIIARGGVTGRDIGAGEAGSIGLADAGHTPGVGIGSEGRTGIDGPSSDDAVDHAGGVHRGAVQVGEVHQARSREADIAHRVIATGIAVGPTLELDRSTVTGVTDEVAHVDAVSTARRDDRLRLQDVAAGDDIQRVERRDGVDGTGADDDEAATLEGDGRRGRNAGRERDRRRIKTEVIPVEGAVEEADRGGGRERAGVDKGQITATDDRLAGVGRGIGQHRGVVAHADEVHLTGDGAGEGAATVGDEVHRTGAGVGDRAAVAGDGVHAGDFAEGLGVVTQVDPRELTVEAEIARGAAVDRREDGDGVSLAGQQVDRAVVDGEVAALEVGGRIEIQRAAAGLDEAGGLADAEEAVDVEGRASEDVADERRARTGSERTHVEGRHTVADEEGGGPTELLREQASAGAEATEGRRQGGTEGRRARERHRIDDRVGAEGDRGAYARVLALRPTADAVSEGAARGGIELASGKSAEVVTEEDGGRLRSDAGAVVDRHGVIDRVDRGDEGTAGDAGHGADRGADEDAGRRGHGDRGVVVGHRGGDRHGVADEEARAETGGGRIGEDVAADHHVRAAVAGDHA